MAINPRVIRRQVAAVLLVALAPTVRAELTLGVHPFRPATELVESFTPLATYLGEKIGEHVRVKVSKDYETHVRLVGTNAVDLAYLGPAPYILVTENYGRKPLLARQSIRDSPTFHGKIFVRRESPIQSLKELVGKKMVFGDSRSTMGHLVPRYMLWQAGITIDQLGGFKHVNNHVNVTLAVLTGEFDAGAVKEDIYFENEARGLRAIATSPEMSDHLFVARSDLSADMIEHIRKAMLTVLEDPNGASIVAAITPGVSNLIQVEDKHYDNLRQILKKLKELGVEF